MGLARVPHPKCGAAAHTNGTLKTVTPPAFVDAFNLVPGYLSLRASSRYGESGALEAESEFPLECEALPINMVMGVG